MLKYFFQWLGTKIKNAESDAGEEESPYVTHGKVSNAKVSRHAKYAVNTSMELSGGPDRESLVTEPVTFKMFKASGGWAIEFRRYDYKNDRQDTSLYVVSDDEELGKHISQIITMEALKR